MKATLVQPPISSRKSRSLVPPLGLLMVAAAMESEGADVRIVDLNLECYHDDSLWQEDRFHARAIDLILHGSPDLVGFTSMAIEAHLCLELARRLKDLSPSMVTVLGGPHFTAQAGPILARYAFVDYVLLGDGEIPCRSLLGYLRGDLREQAMINVARRSPGQTVTERSTAGVVAPDDLPLPAYHLLDLGRYFAINPRRLMCIDDARGCQLHCTFCYSEHHWTHGERRKSISRILSELRQLEALGAREVFFVGDNFLNNPDSAQELCRQIQEAGVDLFWECYATLAQLNPPVIEAMGRAGCRAIFIGVDAVSRERQQDFKKHYYKSWRRLRATLICCLDHGIAPTCALMLTPQDSPAQRRELLELACRISALGADITFNVICVYRGTGLAGIGAPAPLIASDVKARLLYDVPDLVARNSLAEQDPALFPFHSVPRGPEPFEHTAVYCAVAASLCEHFPLSLLRAQVDEGRDLHDFIDAIALQMVDCLGSEGTLHDPDRAHRLLGAMADSLSASTWLTDLFHFERIRLDLPGAEGQPQIAVRTPAEQARCRVREHATVSLPRDLALLRDDSSACPFPLERYVAVKQGSRQFITKLTPDLERSLMCLSIRNEGSPLALDDGAYAGLIRSGVLDPMMHMQ